MPIADYEAAVLAASVHEIRDWEIGQLNSYGRMIAEPPRLEGSHPPTEPGIRFAPSYIALAVAQDLHS